MADMMPAGAAAVRISRARLHVSTCIALGGAYPEALTLETQETNMTLCPIAIVAGCKKCPAFSVCPLKGTIGDYKKDTEAGASASAAADAAKGKSGSKAK